MPNVTKSDLSSQLANPVADKLLEHLYDYMIFAPQFFDTSAGKPMKVDEGDRRPRIFDASKYIQRAYSKGETIKIPNIPRLHALDKQGNVEITDQSLNVTTVSLTITMHKYVSVVIEDAADAFDNTKLADEMAKREAKALAEAFEDSIIALFDDFTTSVGTGVGDVLTFDDFATLNKIFFQNGVNLDHTPAWAILTADQYANLATQRDEYRLGGDKGSSSFNSGRIIETPHGIYAMRSNRLQSAGGAATGLCFTENALMTAFAIKPRFEENRDPRKVGTRFYADFMAGVAKLRDEEGINLNYDADSVIA
jgi:hypothetical protein